ncbi:MAG TPA: UDP-glucose 4-epimerase GalE [Oscillospiraceae bacterium]|nr:UDP-glucose 4-epimerase GalE [Oscillospiraceae bacterium]HPK34902.1 UDP-glucose 4-epimerase GalE [Oscillospiraceae bacterium]
MKILVTGGAGFIGSHTIVELLNAGYEVVSVDNYGNSSPSVNDRIRQIAGKNYDFYMVDAANESMLSAIFDQHKIDCVIHFAAHKAVAESVAQPVKYYKNNLDSLLSVCSVMQKHGCKQIIFSSSATVYGIPKSVPISENFPLSAINPYGQTKLFAEQILRDVQHANPDWSVTLLRYFNPIGAHPSGLIGEKPNDIPNNLLPYVSQVAAGILPRLRVYGGDYPTRDGTGIRDYIHVVDLARGHVAAIDKLSGRSGVYVYNLGTGHGESVLEIVRAMEKASGKEIPYDIVERRPGDSAESYADPSKAERELGWKAQYNLEDMCRDAWRWQQYCKDHNL